MRYHINFDKLVNQLVPYYIGGRKTILYLQALLKPLQSVNWDLEKYAKDTRLEASMTSQVFRFEWFLNKRLSRYFLQGGQIVIGGGESFGAPIYGQNSIVDPSQMMIVRFENEAPVIGDDGKEDTVELRLMEENINSVNTVSFVVHSPKINTRLISNDLYTEKLKYYIDKYRLANKTYEIRIDNE